MLAPLSLGKGNTPMIYRARSQALAALMHADGRFTYRGIEGDRLCFEGDPDLSADMAAYANICTFFRIEAQKLPKNTHRSDR